MKSVYDFIVKPVGERYANTKKIGDTDLIVNTKIWLIIKIIKIEPKT